MDNLTHSLVGALIGQMGLKRKTGLAMPTLIIAANIPDIDAVAVLLGGHQHLAIRRGITHGPIAMVVLPLILWGAMLWFDAWQAKRGKRPDKRLPIHKGWLLALAYVGCLSHPLFDWFNSYGVRLLEPFSSQWYYGDNLFIVDIWLWTIMGFGIWYSLRLEKSSQSDWMKRARTAGWVAATYILINLAISTSAERVADNILRANGVAGRRMVVANPVPVAFWRREILWRNEISLGYGSYSLFSGLELFTRAKRANIVGWTTTDVAKSNDDAAAFLFWSRMPVADIEQSLPGERLILTDQRFSNPLVRNRFKVEVKISE
jgi:inner membrane protein